MARRDSGSGQARDGSDLRLGFCSGSRGRGVEDVKLGKSGVDKVGRGEADFIVIKGASEVGGNVDTRGVLLLGKKLEHGFGDNAPLGTSLAADPLDYRFGRLLGAFRRRFGAGLAPTTLRHLGRIANVLDLLRLRRAERSTRSFFGIVGFHGVLKGVG